MASTATSTGRPTRDGWRASHGKVRITSVLRGGIRPRCPIPLGIVSRDSASVEREDVVRCSRSAAPAMRTCKTQSAQTASGFDTGTVCAGGVGMKILGTNTTVFFVWACIVKSEPKSVVLCLLHTHCPYTALLVFLVPRPSLRAEGREGGSARRLGLGRHWRRFARQLELCAQLEPV